MPKTKLTLKARLGKAYREGAEVGFKQGRQEAERLHARLLVAEREAMRAELAKDARLARFETVTEIMAKLASQVGQSLQVLADIDGRLS